jgi:multisubunit Na+/H+ antiporter MnhG subunit
MGLGLGIVLLVLGAIASFAVADRVEGVDLVVIGYILMGAGVLSIVIGLVMNQQRANTTHREVVDRREDIRDRHIDDR